MNGYAALLVTGVTPEDTNQLRHLFNGAHMVTPTNGGTAFILSNIERFDDLPGELENGMQQIGIRATITGFVQEIAGI